MQGWIWGDLVLLLYMRPDNYIFRFYQGAIIFLCSFLLVFHQKKQFDSIFVYLSKVKLENMSYYNVTDLQ